jgi:hypothetical protein
MTAVIEQVHVLGIASCPRQLGREMPECTPSP